MSTGFIPLTLAEAFWQVQAFTGMNRWIAHAPNHEAWLGMLPDWQRAAAGVSELEAIASYDYPEVNRWLKAKGFGIQLSDPGNPRAFAVAASNDITVEWTTPGVEMLYDGHPGFSLSSGVQVLQHPDAQHPLIRLRTSSGDIVHLHEPDDAPAGWNELLGMVELAISREQSGLYAPYGGLQAPMVKLDVQPDLSWMKGLEVRRDAFFYIIDQALAQIKFGMNHLGARSKDAGALGIRLGGLPRPPYRITRPFLVWFERPDVPKPVSAPLYVTEDDWVDPGDLTAL